MRKLASIQKIIDVQPIPGADAIELVSILGWKVVVKKGEFQPDDLCCYIEIDSLLPRAPWNEFLWQDCKGTDQQYRLRTRKFRGQISQGLALPLSILDGKKFPTDKRENPTYPRKEGTNVSALLGITKYEPAIPAQLAGIAKGLFPSFIPKTDEIRIQSCPGIINEMVGKEVYIATKCDGASVTFFWNKGEFGVCSRNLELKETDDNTMWKLAKKYDLQNKLPVIGYNIAIQGECVGEGIQKNRMGIRGHDILVFNIFNIDTQTYLGAHEMVGLCNILKIPHVPIDQLLIAPQDWSVDILLKMAEGKYAGTNNNREGIVIRPTTETYSCLLRGRLSIKAINNNYLLKEEGGIKDVEITAPTEVNKGVEDNGKLS